MKKNLTDVLFEILNELQTAKDDNINLAVNKARAVVEVSEQIIDAGKLKLEISRHTGIGTEFPELSSSNKLLAISAKVKDNVA